MWGWIVRVGCGVRSGRLGRREPLEGESILVKGVDQGGISCEMQGLIRLQECLSRDPRGDGFSGTDR